MPGDLKIEKKSKGKKKQINKQTKNRKVRPLDFVIMENEIRPASKHVPVVQKMAIALPTNQGPVVQTLDTAIHRINYYPADK